MSSPVYSIIVPAYNAHRSILNTLESIRYQKYGAYEVIIVDDGSTDPTYQKVHDWIVDDPRFRCYKKDNGGVSSARNFGLNFAKGEYIVFVDSDDLLDSDVLASFNSLREEKHYDTLMCKIVQKSDNKETIFYDKFSNDSDIKTFSSDIAALIACKQLLSPCAKAYSRKIINDNRIVFTEGVHLGEDLLFNLDYFSKSQSYAMHQDGTYVYLVDSEGSLSKRYDKDMFVNYENLYIKTKAFCKSMKIHKTGERAFAMYYLSSIYYGFGLLQFNLSKKLQVVGDVMDSNSVLSAAKLAFPSGMQGKYYAIPLILRSRMLFVLAVMGRSFLKSRTR